MDTSHCFCAQVQRFWTRLSTSNSAPVAGTSAGSAPAWNNSRKGRRLTVPFNGRIRNLFALLYTVTQGVSPDLAMVERSRRTREWQNLDTRTHNQQPCLAYPLLWGLRWPHRSNRRVFGIRTPACRNWEIYWNYTGQPSEQHQLL